MLLWLFSLVRKCFATSGKKFCHQWQKVISSVAKCFITCEKVKEILEYKIESLNHETES